MIIEVLIDLLLRLEAAWLATRRAGLGALASLRGKSAGGVIRQLKTWLKQDVLAVDARLSDPGFRRREWTVAALAALLLMVADARPMDAPTVARDYSDQALRHLKVRMDPAMMAVASRHDAVPEPDYWGRVVGWTSYDLSTLPTLGSIEIGETDARLINALRPGASEPPPPARPFILKASEEDRARAEQCLTQAIYYEAAVESLDGMRAVAQTVLNRLRHPGYPKSVCGVVFQGSLRQTGCQFSFTCDGSLARTPDPVLWERARAVAQQALAGFVLASVGTATHYHADYVAPYWAPTLYKIATIGRHIFYRWTGPWGMPRAFTGRYAGGEANLTADILQGLDERTQGDQLIGDAAVSIEGTRTVALEVDGEVRTYTVQIPGLAGDAQVSIQGTAAAPLLAPVRRPPTAQEIADINARLKAMEDPDAPLSTAPRAPASDAGDLPIATRR
ncbi:MAG: cell wall hydrolase [Caulobacter sp.]|nr:cell wall hydrolase [Caulobacter sp.]